MYECDLWLYSNLINFVNIHFCYFTFLACAWPLAFSRPHIDLGSFDMCLVSKLPATDELTFRPYVFLVRVFLYIPLNAQQTQIDAMVISHGANGICYSWPCMRMCECVVVCGQDTNKHLLEMKTFQPYFLVYSIYSDYFLADMVPDAIQPF